ncbi:hypothetical protein ACWEN6_03050 [Sphaerisporangium sp. NPDC004334]
MVLMVCIVVVSVISHIYHQRTGTPYQRRNGGGLYTPDGEKWLWLVGIERKDGTSQTRKMSATWYDVKTWAERESSRYGTVCAWARRAASRDRVRVWTWRNGEATNRETFHLWEVRADRYLTDGERAAIEAKAQRSYEERS